MVSYNRLEELATVCLHYIALQEGDLEGLCNEGSILFTKEEIEYFGITEEETAGFMEE